MKVGICYGGAGHWAVAAMNAGMEPIWYYEKWWPANVCFATNWPHVYVYSTIRHIIDDPFILYKGLTDVIVGSPHCNGMSSANPKNDIDHPSNECVFDFLRVVQAVQPRFFIMEESHRLLSSEKFIKLKHNVLHSLSKMHYFTREEILDAHDYGSPQRRKRTYIFGFKHYHDCDEFYLPVAHEPTYARDVLKGLGRFKEGVDYREPPRRGEKGPYSMYANHRIQKVTSVCPTITGWTWRDTMVQSGKRFIAIPEIAALMGFPPGYKFQGGLAQRCQLIGKGVDIRFTSKLLGSIKEIKK